MQCSAGPTTRDDRESGDAGGVEEKKMGAWGENWRERLVLRNSSRY